MRGSCFAKQKKSKRKNGFPHLLKAVVQEETWPFFYEKRNLLLSGGTAGAVPLCHAGDEIINATLIGRCSDHAWNELVRSRAQERSEWQASWNLEDGCRRLTDQGVSAVNHVTVLISAPERPPLHLSCIAGLKHPAATAVVTLLTPPT